MYIIAWANMLTDFNDICMSATPGHDKTPTWFWGILPYFLSYCRNFAGWIFLLDLRRSSSEGDSTIKLLFYGCDNWSFLDEKLRHSYFFSKYRLWVRLNESPLTHKIYVLEQNKKIIVNAFQPPFYY